VGFSYRLQILSSTVFPQFQVMVEKYFNRSIKSIQTDGGGEFIALQNYWP